MNVPLTVCYPITGRKQITELNTGLVLEWHSEMLHDWHLNKGILSLLCRRFQKFSGPVIKSHVKFSLFGQFFLLFYTSSRYNINPCLFADYGNYGGNNGGGGSNNYGGGHMMVPPPRPAPSADGWSSGENQYDVFDRQQQQQQQQQQHQQQQEYMAAQQAAFAAASQAAYNSQWNIGASEFVPK